MQLIFINFGSAYIAPALLYNILDQHPVLTFLFR